MSTIYKILSNVKHNGQAFAKGEFVADEFTGFPNLVNDGVIKVIDGAETIEEAQKLDDEYEAELKEKAEEEAAAAPKNTWEPKKEEEKPAEPAPTAPAGDDKKEGDDTVTPEPIKHIVSKEDIELNPGFVELGIIEGDEIELGPIVDATPELIAEAVAAFAKGDDASGAVGQGAAPADTNAGSNA